jgi:AcrR family transcriptional regulator
MASGSDLKGAGGDHGTRQRLIDAAVTAIDEHGEAALRLADVAREVGVASGIVAYHFGNRDGLVKAAKLTAFSRQALTDSKAIESVGKVARDANQALHLLEQITVEVVKAERASERLKRVAVLGSLQGRPELLAELGKSQKEITDAIAKAIADNQESGLVVKDLDPEALALFVQAYSIGLVLMDLNPDDAPREAMIEIISRAISSFITPPT